MRFSPGCSCCVGGGGVTTNCCAGVALPTTLFVTFTSVPPGCMCLDEGVPFTLTFVEGSGPPLSPYTWRLVENACGCVRTISLFCVQQVFSAIWQMSIALETCGDGSGHCDASDGGAESVTCDPLNVVFSTFFGASPCSCAEAGMVATVTE